MSINEKGGNMTTIIRPAASDDAVEVAELMYISSLSPVRNALFDLMFPGDAEHRLEQLRGLYLANTCSWFHFSHHLVAEVNGEVAAALCGYGESEAGRLKLAEALTEVGWDTQEGIAFAERMQPVLSVYPSFDDDVWIIENVATFVQYRRMGLINSLLKETVKMGRDNGYVKVGLGIIIGNDPARKAYEKVGFRVIEEYTNDSFEEIFGSPGMARMELEL
jgi:ribosomal protein S18 acetylase RimI-like enzyme